MKNWLSEEDEEWGNEQEERELEQEEDYIGEGRVSVEEKECGRGVHSQEENIDAIVDFPALDLNLLHSGVNLLAMVTISMIA